MFDISLLLSLLNESLLFINNNTRDSFPSIKTTRHLLPNSFHAIEGRRNYFPGTRSVGCATSEAMTSFARACFYAYEATNTQSWLTLGLNITQSFTDYFFVDPIPAQISIWDSHWLCVAYGSTHTKGTQPTTTPPSSPFNYGIFDTIVTFTNGIGIIPNSTQLADVYKVYPVDSSLQYQNVYSPLLGDIEEYPINYWVSNYAMEGVVFRIFPDGSRIVNSTQPVGTISLSNNFTGTAKVVWSDYSGGIVSSPTIPLQGQGLLEPYPMWHSCKKVDGRTFLNTAFDTYWWGWESFELAYKYTNDFKWRRAANSFKFTAQQSMQIDNQSFYYKKENVSFPLRYPGTQAFTTNNNNNPIPSLSISREIEVNKKDYIKLETGNIVIDSYPTLELQNFVVQTEISNNVSVYIEVASSANTILEIKLSTSQDPFDFSQEYISYLAVAGNNTPITTTIPIKNFIRWGTLVTWHPTIADEPVYTFSGSGGSVNYSIFNDPSFGSDNALVFNVVLLSLFPGSFAGFGINNATFGSNPPSIYYVLVGDVKLKIKDSNDIFWETILPDTGNQWKRFEPSWQTFSGTGTPGNGNIKEVIFECNGLDALLKIQYLGKTSDYVPEAIPIPSRTYKSSVVSKFRTPHTLWVGDFKPIGNILDKVPYTPGAVPFTRNTIRVPSIDGFETIEDSWGEGIIYMGYLSPYHQFVWEDFNSTTNQIAMLVDSFSSYNRQSASRIRGLPHQVFLAALWDSAAFVTYGERLPPIFKQVMGFLFPFLFDKKSTIPSIGYKLNEFSWNGADPNTGWFPYAARVMESTARYLNEFPFDQKAKALLVQYLTFLKSDYERRQSIRPLTDIPPIVDPQSNYHEPHAAALIGRCALWGNLAGLSPRLTIDIIKICHDYIISQMVTSGTMRGSFSLGQPTFTHNGTGYREYFSFWHGEIIEFISLLIKYKDNLNYPKLSEVGLFPSIEPTKISTIKLSNKFNEKIYFSDKNRQFINYRKSSQGVKLTLEYESISDEQVNVFLDFYQKHATSDTFTLPQDIRVFSRFRLDEDQLPILFRFSNKLEFKTRVSTKQRGLFNTTITIESIEN